MKSVLKEIFKYIGIFLATICICFSLLVISSKIPKASIEQNMQESADFYKKKNGIEYESEKLPYSFRHYYADSMLLNIIYNINTDNPIQSTLWAKYYQTRYADVNDDFVRTVKFHREANTEYLRYWHGSMMIIRPLMTIFNIENTIDRIRELIEDMVDTMHKYEGVGLAAVQVGILKRILVIDLYDEKTPIIRLINPVIIKTKGTQEVEEGCLSFPNKYVRVVRPNEVTVEGLNEKGEKVVIKGKGLLAQALSHEIDHLNGVVLTDVMIPGTMEYVNPNEKK